MLKVLSINTFEKVGGAARSVVRLHHGLQDVGVEASLVVQYKSSSENSVIGPSTVFERMVNFFRPYLDALPVLLYRSRLDPPWSVSWLSKNINKTLSNDVLDIVHLHWINYGFLSIRDIARIDKPIVWTLHDSWPFTGGCNLPGNCRRYQDSCGSCPQLNSFSYNDLSHWIWEQKHKYWRFLNLTVVTPSRWLAECSRSSTLFRDVRIEVIPNGIDTDVYKAIDRQIAREKLSLPQQKTLLMFGAANYIKDRNKGFEIFLKALDLLAVNGWGEKVDVILFGAKNNPKLPQTGFTTHCFGEIKKEEELVLLYSAADLFVLPSIQENLPNTVIESMACSTPCVAFSIGGLPDIIDHKMNGYLAEPFSIQDLADGICWSISDIERHCDLSRWAREKIELEFDVKLVAKRYLNLYMEIMS